MFDKPVEKMDYKELRNAVQILSDEIIRLKKKQAEGIYELGDENFSSVFIKEKKNMKSEIKITADAIKTKVSKTELDGKLEKYSTVSQTAEAIKATVTEEYVDTLIDGTYVKSAILTSELEQTAAGIRATVAATYETKEEADKNYEALNDSIATVDLTANSFTTRIEDLENFNSSTFTQTENGFMLDGNKTTVTGVIYLTDNEGNNRFAISHDETGTPQVFMHGINGNLKNVPLILGDRIESDGVPYDTNVYAGTYSSSAKFVTVSYLENNPPIAVFG